MTQNNDPNIPNKDEQFRLAIQTEQELARFSRQYVILDRDRAQFLQAGGGKKLAKHQKVIKILTKEQNNIKTNLFVASAKEKVLEDKKRSTKLSILLNEYDQFDNKIKIETHQLKDIEYQILVFKHKLLDLAAQQISEFKFQERTIKSEKVLEKLENKLEVQVRKFCAICADNCNLRSELEHLLLERTHFNRSWNQLIKNLNIGKKIMLDLIEQATLAYDQREEWVTKLQLLRTKAHNDLLSHIQEMRTLQRKKDHDTKVQEFFAIKGQKRIMRDLEDKHWEERIARNKKLESQTEEYTMILNKIQEFTQQENVQDITKSFLNQEEENFAMFKYVTDLNSQMEEISDNLELVHRQIDKQNILHLNFEEQQAKCLQDLGKQMDEMVREATEKETELQFVNKKLNLIENDVAKLFKLFGCKNDPLVQMLGHNETIHQYNILLYLDIIENNVQESLVCAYQQESLTKKSRGILRKKESRHSSIIIQDRKPKCIENLERICSSNPCPLCIEHEMVSDVIDELQFPLTKEDVQEKLKDRQTYHQTKEVVHNVSICHLPKSRQIIQKRYQ